ncbi:Vacuolar protein sorting-associated protein ist1 [Perkinsus olseni]|uniref:Vacuolar protein sorting-associated protein ist1 n=1 Tax=Perkinsus olseni TaxID=32597 RepID=A0A7J6L1U5_PEROL|nr:Vacuolar protein sorting-associated protein ist1 [Perkinsus olseni]KAF4655621.1 Vacuolar protein sorting-associated protein ist1 [Perkinsus olseni]
MPFFSRYDPRGCEASLRGLETSLVEKTEKLREVQAMLELQIRDLLPEREGAAQTLGGRCCQIPRQMKAYDLLAMQCRLLYERMAEVNQSKVCPSDLIGVVGTIVYAAEVMDLEHLQEARRQLGLKYGEKFCRPFHDSWTRGVDQNFVALIAVYEPRKYEVFDVLEKVAVANKIHWTRPVDTRRPPDLSARIRASICEAFERASPRSLMVAESPLVHSVGSSQCSGSLTHRRSTPKQDALGDETPPASRFAPPLPPHLRKRVSNSTSSVSNGTPRRSTASSTATPPTCSSVKSTYSDGSLVAYESGVVDATTPRGQACYPSGYDVPVTPDDVAYEELRLRLERIRRGS